jgi:surfactin synthase thioesterase subunit
MTEQAAAIKLRGIPFEPEQVINALMEHPQINQANINLMKDSKDRNLLVAFVTLKAHGTTKITDLREYAKTKLSPQFVPDFFVIHTDQQSPGNSQFNINLKEQGFEPPRDSTDTLILDIWTDLLEKIVGIDDDFFASGGHSLLAVDLLSRIEKSTGQTLPLSTMLTSSTIRGLSDALVKGIAPAEEGEIVELQQGRGGTPLFFLHGDYTGGGFFSRDVARHADLDGPFYIVQPYGLGRSEDLKLPDSVEGLAAQHLKRIREKQPNGPYRLAGHCNGGVIAFEIAQQLMKSGEKVEYLGMIDPLSAYDNTGSLRQNIPADIQDASSESSLPLEEENYRRWLLRSYLQMTAKYEASVYNGHLSIILLAEDNNKTDQTPGWANIAKNNTIHRINVKDGDHSRAIQQNSGTVGELISSDISRMQ